MQLPRDAFFDEMDSPVGTLIIIGSKAGLHAILWDTDSLVDRLMRSKTERIIIETKKQLNEYFQVKRSVFDLPLVLGGTNFQVQAWQELQNIPYGKTISYAEQAEKMGDKNKARAVGMANGQNPISIVIPCHRVIGKNGNLVGFGGGIEKKAYLLNFEKSNIYTTIPF